jgi:hypothetical protein
MLDTQRPQLLDVAEQLAIDVVFDFRHGWCSPRAPVRKGPSARYGLTANVQDGSAVTSQLNTRGVAEFVSASRRACVRRPV